MLKILALIRGAEGDRRAVEARPARAADAVDVRLRHLGNVEVDDVRKLFNVDSSRGNIRRDQHAAAALLKGRKSSLPGPLRFVAVNRLCREARAGQIARHAVGPVLRSGENEHGDKLRILQKIRKQMALVALVDKIDVLPDRFHRRGRRVHLHHGHVVQQAIRDLLNFRRHGGGKKQRLLLLRRFVDHTAHIVDKAHVKHAVSLVENENLEAVEAHMALADEIVEPPRRCDENIHAVFQRRHLRSLPHASENHRGAQPQISAVQLKILINLQGKLPRRRQHERADRPFPLRHAASCQKLQDRHGKSRRLARSRLRTAEQIPPLQHRRDRRLLNRRRPAIARLPQRFENRGDNVKLFKCHTIHPNFVK